MDWGLGEGPGPGPGKGVEVEGEGLRLRLFVTCRRRRCERGSVGKGEVRARPLGTSPSSTREQALCSRKYPCLACHQIHQGSDWA